MHRSMVMACLGMCVLPALAADALLVDASDDPATGFGDIVEALPDVTEDGVPEFAVGRRTTQEISIRDGATGDELFVLTPFDVGSAWGDQIKLVGDLDGDDVRDLYVGQWGSGRRGSPPGFGTVVSLVTRRSIVVCQGTRSTGFFGWDVADMGDVTGDGVPDVVIGEPGVGGVAAGNSAVYSGSDGARLEDRAMYGTGSVNLGVSVCCLGDVDGDGVNDYCAGAPNANPVGQTFRGEVRVRGGAPDGVEFAIPGGLRKFRNAAGDRVTIGDFFGSSVAGGDVNGDGTPDLVATGRVQGGFLRVLSVGKRAKLLGQVDNPLGSAGDFAGDVAVMPNADGLPGSEVIVSRDNGVLVYSFGAKVPHQVASLSGGPGEFVGLSFAAASDLGTSSSNPLPDNTPDIFLASSVTGRAFALAMPTQTPQLPTAKVKQATPFSKTAATQGANSSGRLKTTIVKGRASFAFAFRRLPEGESYALFLETGPGSGAFTQEGTLAGASRLPAELGGEAFSSLGGRLVELRNAMGDVALSSVLPYASAPQKAKLAVPFEVAEASPFPGVVAVSKLSVNAKSGKTSFLLRLKHVAKSEPLELWGEAKPGTGDFAKIADLKRGAIKLDSKRGLFFPNFPRVDIAALVRRILQIRDGLGRLVMTTGSSNAGAPDFVARRIKLRFVSVLDSFIVRTNVRNRGTAAAGPVNIGARVDFTLEGVALSRSIGVRTNVDFPAGQLHEDLVIGTIDNPFAGQRPSVAVTVTVDPDSIGGSGEYAESDETNNVRVKRFIVDPLDNGDYISEP